MEGQEERTLMTSDGVSISAVHVPGPTDLCLVVVHGFTGSWRQERVQKVIDRLRAIPGRVAIFSHGHFSRVLAATWLGVVAGRAL